MKHGKDFLLTNEYAKTLYTRFAAYLPVIDYSCRIPYDSINKNAPLSNVWEIWQSDERILSAMRACGTEEKYVTGDSSDYEKIRALCNCMPSLFGNPVYTLSHMALQTFFGCISEICPENCDAIWRYTADLMQKQSFTFSSLLSRLNFDTICASVDISDIPENSATASQTPRVLPVICVDDLLLAYKKEYGAYIDKLSQSFGIEIDGLAALELTLDAAFSRGEKLGSKSLRCTLPSNFRFERPDPYHAEQAFFDMLDKRKASEASSVNILTAQLLRLLFARASLKNWTVQIYISGTDVGELDRLLSYMKEVGILPRVMILTNNLSESAKIYTLCEKYSVGNGKMPSVLAGVGYGSTSDKALKEELLSFAEGFALGKMSGVATDSTSLISLFAHDLFKRILCSLLGEWIEEGRIPSDMARAGALIKAICFDNVKTFFKL